VPYPKVDIRVAQRLIKLGYEKGFYNGIRFCNDNLGKFGDLIDEAIEHGNLPEDFD